ncbi:MAG TPA: formylglycine-generating enzyme family protein [Gemmataceae bacterium]|nr:formylglycine-generating enzyme family protein [Gemmataceae bacterium]
MSSLTPLAAFALRQTVPTLDGGVESFVVQRLSLATGPLRTALGYAAARSWRALAVALAPAEALKSVDADDAGDAVWIGEQLHRFAQQTGGLFAELSNADRLACLAECRYAGNQPAFDYELLGRRTAAHRRCDDAITLAAAAVEAQACVADELADSAPRLCRLLRDHMSGALLLAATFAYFFRREVETHEELSSELMCDSLRRLSAPLAGALAALAQALGRLGSRFDVWIGRILDRGRADPRPDGFSIQPPVRPCSPRRHAGGQSSGGSARSSALLVSQVPVSSVGRPGPTYVHSLGMQFVWVPPGEFIMGSLEDEVKRDADERQRCVRITRGFFIGAFPVTRGQFTAFVRAAKYVTEAERKGGARRGPSGEWRLDPRCSWKHPDFPQEDDHPVVCVSWNDAQAFCAWMGRVEGHREGPYRLPTEAEWEYACRAGASTAFWPGDALLTDQANYDGQAGCNDAPGLFREGTTPVWVFPPNPWGLYDVHGNVWEWCADWYAPYAEGDATDPQGPPSGRSRVLRGGSWRNQLRFLRAAARNQLAPSGRDRDIGLRVCLTV